MHNEPSSFLLLRLCSSLIGPITQICEGKFKDLTETFFWQISGMGNAESAKKKHQKKAIPHSGATSTQGKTLNDTKKILLLHKSDAEQIKVVRNFRDALTSKANGSIRVTDFINVADGSGFARSLPWLEELNNVVLICLTSEAIAQLEKIVRDKQFADEHGHLHGKVFSVSFGENLSSEWPPQGLQKGSLDARDFHFGFKDVGNLRPQDFERSDKMNALVASIKGTK